MLTVTPPAGYTHAIIATRLMGWLLTAGIPADRIALRALAIERDELYRQLGAARGEADRLRVMLRRWQAQHHHCVRRGPANQGRWGDLHS